MRNTSPAARPGDVVLVEWLDACHYGVQATIEQALNMEPQMFESVGFLVRLDRQSVVFAQEHSSNSQVRDTMVVPRRMVVSVKVLRRHRRPAKSSPRTRHS